MEKSPGTPVGIGCRVQAEQFFSGKNPAVYSVNPRIFPLASAKNSQKHPPANSHSVPGLFSIGTSFNICFYFRLAYL